MTNVNTTVLHGNAHFPMKINYLKSKGAYNFHVEEREKTIDTIKHKIAFIHLECVDETVLYTIFSFILFSHRIVFLLSLLKKKQQQQIGCATRLMMQKQQN